MIGSTEWVEDNREWLNEEAVAYINCDSATAGPYFGAGGSPSLTQLLYEVTSMIKDPLTGKTIYEAWGERSNATDVPTARPPVEVIGSGSDFTAFMSHVGIPSIDMGFSGDYGVYHSVYDRYTIDIFSL
jgi:hypothetical protein